MRQHATAKTTSIALKTFTNGIAIPLDASKASASQHETTSKTPRTPALAPKRRKLARRSSALAPESRHNLRHAWIAAMAQTKKTAQIHG
jgi:hypothetical protein